jgi:hypothetical protein
MGLKPEMNEAQPPGTFDAAQVMDLLGISGEDLAAKTSAGMLLGLPGKGITHLRP